MDFDFYFVYLEKQIKSMKKILVCIDVQNDFITDALRNTDAIKKVPNIVNKLREFNGDAIIYTLDTHFDNYLDTKEGQKLPVKHCIKGSDGWKLHPEVEQEMLSAKLRGIRVFEIQKPTFGSTTLHDDIRSVVGNEEFEIEFCGFCTDICVVSNVLMTKAYFYETANIYVDAKCCAGVTKESHEAALTTMEMCQINILNK